MARLRLDRTESSPPFRSWEPRGAPAPGTALAQCTHNGARRGAARLELQTNPPAGPSTAAKPPEDLRLLPTLTTVQRLRSSSLGVGGRKRKCHPLQAGW